MTPEPSMHAWLRRLREGRRTAHGPEDDAAPLRAELYTADQMEQHGAALAIRHGARLLASAGEELLARLDANQRALADARRLVATAVRAECRITPAGEWLLDNHYLIEDQIRTARAHLPRGYSRELPCLATGPSRGLPRVYDLALEAIAHGDGRIDEESLARFVAAYQSEQPLTLGELWAIPIMLRLALIENLRRVGVCIGSSRRHLDQAQDWADRMIAVATDEPKDLILVIADMARSRPPMASPFVAELARRLQGHGPALALPLTWIEQRLAEASLTIDALVQAEAHQQAADQVSISNSIGSLRFLDASDWRVFVESMSGVERVLRQDPAGCHPDMDFATRDQYRHVIDAIAKRSPLSEVAVAQAAIALARDGLAAHGAGDVRAHVGYYLVDAGLPLLQQAAKLRSTSFARLRGALERHPRSLYLGAILLLATLCAAGWLLLAGRAGATGWQLALLALPAWLVASQLASALCNWIATLLVRPRHLPRMDYASGIPPAMRTLVAVPCMLLDAAGIDELLEALEVRFLGNRDACLHFALLTDFRDAASATLPADAALLQRARAGIEALNRRHPGDADTFLLLHRARRWNPAQGVWMGHERKRGKLGDLNAALRGGADDRFAQVVGALPAGVRYVITLDSDTSLPRDTARAMVGAMAHPLNRPRFDARSGLVVAGYGILQPRVSPGLPGSQRSRHARMGSSEAGVDPYTRAVSDVYQDLFGEGSFIGKGIYDVDAFERALAGRLPENRILSHDLLEGCHARSGLQSDVQLHEDHPPRYASDLARQERWIRGDWQIACWLLPRVPGPDGRRLRNPLSALSRAKILDNLRRSLVAPALLALLLLGWAWPASPWWPLAVLSVLWLPPVLAALVEAPRKPARWPLAAHLRATAAGALASLGRAGFRLACLPHEAAMALSAIARTLWRTRVSGRQLLCWRVEGPAVAPAATLAGYYRELWAAPGAAALGLAVAGTPGVRALALPVLGLWLAAPAIVRWLDQPPGRPQAPLAAAQRRFLRRLARRTFAYFEQFVAAEDHWLPPDNFQLQPGPVLATRTSPTNIGLALLANLSAREFGYIGSAVLLERSAATLATMARMERHQGHFYNWYDTRTLQALPPRYVSSVDSGNLAGYLLTLRAGLLEIPLQPAFGPQLLDGLDDALGVYCESTTAAVPAAAQLRALLDAALAAPPQRLSALAGTFEALLAAARSLREAHAGAPGEEAASWADALHRQCAQAVLELQALAPWLALVESRGAGAPFSTAFEALMRQAPCGESAGLPTLRQLADCADRLLPALDARLRLAMSPRECEWLARLRTAIVAGQLQARLRIVHCNRLAHAAGEFAAMEWAFLYDSTRKLLAVGYNVDQYRRDGSYYDLLASEARFGNFVAIAQGQLPQESWFALGRLLTRAGGAPLLLSWSGSMFEYLMPQLVMPVYAGTLLAQTCTAAVAQQIAYGRHRGLPWGVSESGYYSFDAARNYQYHAFGVPGLGLRRGLGEDAVIAPYASALALLVAPAEACANLQRLAGLGLLGRHGLHEAIDYTPARQLPGESAPVVRSFMAHHQGMTLLALDGALHDRPMQRRFAADLQVRATLLLLQERVPRTPLVREMPPVPADSGRHAQPAASTLAPLGAWTPTPEVQLLSNGRYHVMVSNAGGGYSRWKDLAVTRWNEDSSCDDWGSFIYLRDVGSSAWWSVAHQPGGHRADSYQALFPEGRAEFRRVEHGIESHCEIVVSPEDDVELRRVHLTNRSTQVRRIELTSYLEWVLARPAADQMHPAFAKLFLQTEVIAARRAILCTRRPRSREEATPWACHLLASNGTRVGEVSCETDRMRFLGRGGRPASARALAEPGPLSGSCGAVLDAIAAIRCEILVEPGQSATLDFITGAAATREACMSLVDRYQDRHLADRALDLAGTHADVTRRQINASEGDARLYRQLAGPVLYASAALRADSSLLQLNRRGQSGLWGYAISGDLPIVLLQIADGANLVLARQLVQCHAWWRLKGLAVDLVIWNEDQAGYRQRLQDQIVGLIATGTEAHAIDRPGGIYVRCAEQIAAEDRVLLQTVARAVLSDARGSLAEQLAKLAGAPPRLSRLAPVRAARPPAAGAAAAAAPTLPPGHPGGFNADGSEYLIHCGPGLRPPLPWVNVLANPHFGCVIAESGLGYTFAENAHEYRLTPWSDDPVGASGGEAFYLRDEDSGRVWSPTPLPCPGDAPYLTRHGFGYSVFEHRCDGIASELTVFVDRSDAVRFSVLRVRNLSGRRRRLSATGYVEWVLGDLRSRTAMHVVTGIDRASGLLCARNHYNTEFAGRVAFLDVDDLARSLTGDRSEFLGRNGSLASPDALARTRLSGRVGAALDPCGAIQVPFELGDGQAREVIFRLGAGSDIDRARELGLRLRKPGSARQALERVRRYWQHTLGAVTIETPDPALDVLVNGWLVYQTLACRMWARSGCFQSGGAFGFRDQLQDSMALVHAEPALVREHLLRCAGRQYLEGDVQHWWHPPAGRGVRTRCSDDYLWLPLAICRYVEVSGDRGVLDEPVHFLEGRPLAAGEESCYDLPAHAEESASLYQHGVRAIRHGLRFGEHGLPLMGSGDWNDGMNLVGIHGKGESVWLGFFLYRVLGEFGELAQARGDVEFAASCRQQAQQLRANLARHGWDGAWYRRAYFDDGTPLGSALNSECSIDSIAQSWAVLSGASDPQRMRAAMDALDLRLVRREAGLVQLLDPPFDHSSLDPGYIKGYLPGVRENGGQYTHAAVWAAMAFAQLRDSRRAWELLALIDPLAHARDAAQVATYKAEPYVVAADVYARPPHVGRGGWSWYTGSAGWCYRLVVESLLGLDRRGDRLRLAPCLPAAWSHCTLRYRFGASRYRIAIAQHADGEHSPRVSVDGVPQDGDEIALVDDGREHEVQVTVGRSAEDAVAAPGSASP